MTAGSVYTTPFTLVTPDKQRIDVDPLVLAGTSKFFANVLASSSQIQTSTYNVDDLSSHVQLYLDAVKDGACPTDEQDWYTVFRLADKYDSVLAKSVLFSAIDVWLPANPEAAFAAAHLLGCSHLAAALSHRFTPSFQSQSSLFNQIPETEVELLILKERSSRYRRRAVHSPLTASAYHPDHLCTLSMAVDSVFASPFTLISVDEERFTVDPLVLGGTSKVFADMLRTGCDGEKTCTLTELGVEVRAYLKAIEEGVCPNDEDEWFALFKMADKYDSVPPRNVLFQAVDSWLPTKPASSFAALCILGAYNQTYTLRSRVDFSTANRSPLLDRLTTTPPQPAGSLSLARRVYSLLLGYPASPSDPVPLQKVLDTAVRDAKRQILLDAEMPACRATFSGRYSSSIHTSNTSHLYGSSGYPYPASTSLSNPYSPYPSSSYRPATTYCTAGAASSLPSLWAAAIPDAMRTLKDDPLPTPGRLVLDRLLAKPEGWPACKFCVEGIVEAVEKLEKAWEVKEKEMWATGVLAS
ncbi:hypothetical protein JCM8097_009313 [Rhodosporidiobolus ruineniae]